MGFYQWISCPVHILNPPIKPTMFWDNPAFFLPATGAYHVGRFAQGYEILQNLNLQRTRTRFKIKDFISCMTTHMVYALLCPCNLYIGRTKQTLGKRVSEHIKNIKNGYKDHSI